MEIRVLPIHRHRSRSRRNRFVRQYTRQAQVYPSRLYDRSRYEHPVRSYLGGPAVERRCDSLLDVYP